MRIVVMSDTHLSRPTDEFKHVCSTFCEDADMVIHLGDWDKAEVLVYMDQYRLEAVAGNMDDYSIQEQLPNQKVVTAGAFRIGITHGWGSPAGIRQRLRQNFSAVDAILFGHTHQPLILWENDLLWFNPGSLFCGRGTSRKSIGVIHVQDRIEAEIVQL
ncbi:MAG: metallophosphoesterase [Desulfobacteraceae bacterium]|nr:metallophosphoesterase [Desulfobacteraceae bacterium]